MQDLLYSRALCGFRPHLLTADSHLQLVRYVLREMGLIPTPVLLQDFAVRAEGGSVRVRWRLADPSDPAEFRLGASSGGREWTVPHTRIGAREFSATEDSPQLDGGGTVTYSLFRTEPRGRICGSTCRISPAAGGV